MDQTATMPLPVEGGVEAEALIDSYLHSTRRLLDQMKAEDETMRVRQNATQAAIDELLRKLSSSPRR